jgi:hypothetical protein
LFSKATSANGTPSSSEKTQLTRLSGDEMDISFGISFANVEKAQIRSAADEKIYFIFVLPFYLITLFLKTPSAKSSIHTQS